MMYKKCHYSAVFPVVLTALLADRVCHLYPIHHTPYAISEVPPIHFEFIGWSVLAGVFFGLTAMVFAGMTRRWDDILKKKIYYPPLRPVIGGAILALVVFGTGMTRYLGLGIPVIVEAFEMPVYSHDFFLKMLFTSLTLGAGFKGGEVTPLFFMGATLGNALAGFIPLPMSLLAGMGMVGVFAGAVHAPLACTIMGIELFGTESAIYLFVACSAAYLFSGRKGIYSSQEGGGWKNGLYKWFSRK
jgi:H+/Cl- antiporter ClcA